MVHIVQAESSLTENDNLKLCIAKFGEMTSSVIVYLLWKVQKICAEIDQKQKDNGFRSLLGRSMG